MPFQKRNTASISTLVFLVVLALAQISTIGARANETFVTFESLLSQLNNELRDVQASEPTLDETDIRFTIDRIILRLAVLDATQADIGLDLIVPVINANVDLGGQETKLQEKILQFEFYAYSLRVSEPPKELFGIAKAIETFKKAMRTSLMNTEYLKPRSLSYEITFGIENKAVAGVNFIISSGIESQHSRMNTLIVELSVERNQ